MGVGRVSAVSDAGPLIHLAEIDCFSLLSIFERLHIAEAVWQETVESGYISQADILKLGNVQRHTLSQAEIARFIEKNDLRDLHKGERECLYLCQQIGTPILLTDDLAVREAAQRLSLRPVGSLGIVVRAHLMGHISLVEAEQCIIELYETSSLFITRAIVELAVEQLHKYTDQNIVENT